MWVYMMLEKVLEKVVRYNSVIIYRVHTLELCHNVEIRHCHIFIVI